MKDTTDKEPLTHGDHDDGEVDRLSWRAIVTTVYILLGTFLAGYNMACLNSPGKLIEDFMNETSMSRDDGPMSEETLTSLYALLSSIFAVGAGIGALSTQTLADITGRRRLVWLNAIVGVGAALMMALSQTAESHEMLFVGRFIVGLVAGVGSGTAPFYLAEILPRRVFGPAMLANSVSLQFSTVVAGIVGFDDIFSTPDRWVYIVGCSGVMSVLQLILAPIAVPSPTFLLMRARDGQAAKALRQLRGRLNVSAELTERQRHIKSSKDQREMSVLQLLRTRSLRKMVVLVVFSFISMFFTGLIVVIFYSVSVLQSAGLSERNARYVAPAVSCSGVLVTCVLFFVIHRLPRRVMHLVGLGGLVVNGTILTLALVYNSEASWLDYVGAVAIPLMAASHSFGPSQVPWLLVGELFDDKSRTAASSLSTMTLWFALFTVGYAFPEMDESMGDYSVVPFVGLAAAFFVFFFVFQPETLHSGAPTETAIRIKDDNHKKYGAVETQGM